MRAWVTSSVLVALLALGALGWWAASASDLPGAPRVVLLTKGWQQVPPPGLPIYRLPEAMSCPNAQTVPDVATLRRLVPALRALDIRGLGLDPVQAAELRGVEVTWSDTGVAAAGAEIVAVTYPRELALGDLIRVSGRLAGLAPGSKVTLGLEEPDGYLRRVEVLADDQGNATFAVAGRPTRAVGRFGWRLRVGEVPVGSPLGVVVAAVQRPRVLVLQAAPSWELARLHEWLIRGGHDAALLTRVSSERWRWVSSAEAVADKAELQPALLARFDVLVATEEALLDLKPEEARALEAAVREGGLGILVVGEPQSGRAPSVLVPAGVTLESSDSGEATRSTRLRLASGREGAEPLMVWAANWEKRPLRRILASDPQGRVLAAQEPLGQGWLGRSLVVDAWRWPLAGQASDYAALWSEMLGALARPKSLAGAWRLTGTEGLIEAGRAVDLQWTGNAGREPMSARLWSEGSSAAIDLRLTALPSQPGEVWTRVWPAKPGWHRLETEGGGLDWHVVAPEDWPGIQRFQRSAATAALVAESTQARAPERTAVASAPSLRWRGLAWLILVAALGALWWRERQGGR